MEKRKIYIILLVIMAFWGGTLVSIKVLVTQYHPFTLTATRIFIASICLWLLLYSLKKIRLPKRQEWKWIMLASILGVILHHLLLSTGLQYTTSVKSSLISGFSPILTAIFALFFGLNEWKLSRFFGFLLGGVGIFIAVSAGKNVEMTVNIGDFFILLSFISQALSFILIRKVSQTLDSVVLTCYMLLVGSLPLILIATITNPSGWVDLLHVPYPYMLLLIATAVFAISIGHAVYNYAISQIGAAETAIIGNFNVIFALIFAAIFLNEPILLAHLIGLVCIVIGVLFGTGAMEEIFKKWKNKKSDS
ncbi:MAG: DMT family transporter [Solibacillus sp.]